MAGRLDRTRTFAHTCARTIAGLAIDTEASAMVCVIVASQAEGSVMEIDASTAMYGSAVEPTAGLLEFARRLSPAIEALARELARERGDGFERRADLERDLAEGDMVPDPDAEASS